MEVVGTYQYCFKTVVSSKSLFSHYIAFPLQSETDIIVSLKMLQLLEVLSATGFSLQTLISTQWLITLLELIYRSSSHDQLLQLHSCVVVVNTSLMQKEPCNLVKI